MLDDWDALRIFIALARTETIAGAALRIQHSDSTVRRRIAQLETSLGTLLFDRIDGRYLLTDLGRELMASAEKIEQTVLAADEALRDSDTSLAGLVRVGALDGVGTCCVAPALARLQRSHPDLQIELFTLSGMANVVRRDVDVAILPCRPNSGGEHRIRLLPSITVRLYGSREYLDGSPPIRSPECLAAHRLIGYPDYVDFEGPMKTLSRRYDLPQPQSFSSHSIIAQMHATLAGLGLALLPDYVVHPPINLVPVLHDEVEVRFPLWLMIHAGVAAQSKVRAVVKVIDEMVLAASQWRSPPAGRAVPPWFDSPIG